MEYLGDNPLQNSIDVRLLAKFVTPQKIEDIVTQLKNKDFVDDVSLRQTPYRKTHR